MRATFTAPRAAFVLLLCLGSLLLPPPARADAGELRARYADLREVLRRNSFGQALHIDSAEQNDRLTGDVYAVLDHPFGLVSSALGEASHWCDFLILPFNTKYCHAIDGNGGPALLLRIGRKADQPLEQAYRVDFGFRDVARRPEYFEARLLADKGPVGTRDYRIVVSAIPLEGERTFLRLHYSYAFGMASRLAMGAYLNTVGADKVGFTVTGRAPNGQPELIGGMRGAIERTAMRYYLAVDAYLDSLAKPPRQQVDSRIQRWFRESERYPRQLREMDWPTYASMKLAEVQRQQTLIE